jgi:hypothetical protein
MIVNEDQTRRSGVKQAEQAERACHNLRQTWHRRAVPLAASRQGCAPVSAAVSASAPASGYVPVPVPSQPNVSVVQVVAL